MCIKIAIVVLLVALCVLSKPHETSSKRKIVDEDLSNLPHVEQGQHNLQFDHEAFLGKDEAKRFDDLTPEESKSRLGLLVDKIDANGDGKITSEEMSNWITRSSKRMIYADVDRAWKDLELSDNDVLTWEAHVREMVDDDGEYADDDDATKKSLLAKDERRWKVADENTDGSLSKSEYMSFLHPEHSPKMRTIVVQETIEDLDKNRDNFVDVEEFINDLWSPSPGEEEPDWIATEREQFRSRYDKNGDGKLDVQEVTDWIMPDDHDYVQTEVKHLFSESDTNEDGVLTKEEILNRYDLFVGSQATNFGEALVSHDEL